MKRIKIRIRRLKLPWFELLGWYGTAAYLSAYTLVSAGAYNPQSFGYQFLNITGSLAFVLFAHNRKIYQSVVANGIWLIVGIIAVINILAASGM